MRALFLVAALLGTAVQAQETLTREEREVSVVRWYDISEDTVKMEILPHPAQHNHVILCFAANDAGEPVATANGFSNLNYVIFEHIRADEISQGMCWAAPH